MSTPGVAQLRGQHVAEHVHAEHADETRVAAEPRDRNRGVGRRAAGVFDELAGYAGNRRRPRQQIDQRFAEAHDRPARRCAHGWPAGTGAASATCEREPRKPYQAT
jgi:hypothetical protein